MFNQLVKLCVVCRSEISRDQVRVVRFKDGTQHYSVTCKCGRKQHVPKRKIETPLEQSSIDLREVDELITISDQNPSTLEEALVVLSKGNSFFSSLMKHYRERKKLSFKQMTCVARALRDVHLPYQEPRKDVEL